MNRLLGVHVNSLVGGLADLLESWKPPVVVTLAADPIWNRLKSVSPGTVIVYRHIEGEKDLPGSLELPGRLAELAGERVRAAVKAAGDMRFDYLQLTNEPAIPDRETLARLAAFEVEAMQAAAALSVKLALGTFSVGNPRSIDWWDSYYPALRAGRKYGACLLLHEYNYPSMQTRDDSWYTLRHRRVYNRLPEELRLPLVIGECGLDAGVRRREGSWRGHIKAEEYVRQLELYDAELQRDSYVLGAAIYCAGQKDAWWEFNIWPEPITTLAQSASPLYRGETIPKFSLGVDVSWWQGTAVDWGAVARSGITFAILRASRGVLLDAIYLRNCREIDPGIRRSAYHYVTAADRPEDQVRACARQLRNFPNPVWADLEDNKLTDQASRAFVLGLEQAVGAIVGIYTSQYKASQIKLGAWAAEHPLWVADWGGRPEPRLPRPWEEAGKSYTYWQFKVADSWSGFPGRVDLNRTPGG
jgi:GH25 family lysozyme M1 (1,4-beta-N-acetylmuramidase)